MKVVPLFSYADAYNRAMDIKSENKTSQGKKKESNEESMEYITSEDE